MKNKKKIIASILLPCTLVGSIIAYKQNNKVDIAQNISQTQVAEHVSMPYINPEWDEYMNLSEEEKNKIDIIPEKYIYKYIPQENLYDNYADLPSKFNLRDEYATPIKD